MPDKNYNVDDILSEIRAKKTSLQEEPPPTAPRPKLTQEDKQLLGRALDHNKEKGFLSFGDREEAPRQPQPEEPPRRWQPAPAPTVTPVSQRQPEPPEPKPPEPGPFPAGGASDRFDRAFEENLLKKTETITLGEEPADEPLWGGAPPRAEGPDRMAKAAAFITGLSDGADPDGAPLAGEEAPEEKRKPRHKAREPKAPEEPAREERGLRPSQQLARMKTSLTARLAVNLIAALGVLYLAAAAEYQLPLPGFLTENLSFALWIPVVLVILSGIASGNTVGGGMIALFTLKPSSDSYIALGVFACLMQGSYIAMRPELYEVYSANIYLPMAALMLVFNTVGKLMLRGRVENAYRLVAARGEKQTVGLVDNAALARHLVSGVVEEEPVVACFAPVKALGGYLEQAFAPGRPEDVSRIVAPMTAGAALVMALVSYIFNRDVFMAAGVFTAALCITAPLAGVLAANLPISMVNGRLEKWGAALSGYGTVEQFSGVNGVILKCSDLFPSSSITLHGIKPFRGGAIDQAIVDAASVLCSCDSTLTDIFRNMVSGENILRPAESLVYEDRMGVSAWVDGRRVLVGNRELMKHYGVDIPPLETEQKYAQDGRQVLYVANSGEAAAMFIVSYKADQQMKRALEVLWSRDIAVCVYSTDPNVTEERISQLYDFPAQMIKIIPAALHSQVDRYLAPRDKMQAGIVHTGQPASYVRAVAAAKACDSILTAETALLLLSVVVGFALVTFFAFTRSMQALTWITIAIYQLFWTLIEVLVPAFKRG